MAALAGDRRVLSCLAGGALSVSFCNGRLAPRSKGGLRTVTRRTLKGAVDRIGLAANIAETSAMSMLSELTSAARVDGALRDSDDNRGRFSRCLEGVSFFTESLLLVVAVDIVLIRTEDGVLMVPERSLMGVFCADVLSASLGLNTPDDEETLD